MDDIDWLFIVVAVCAVCALLFGCGDASTYDDKTGHYTSTSDYKQKYDVETVCHRASCWDDKSGRFIGADDYNSRRRDDHR